MLNVPVNNFFSHVGMELPLAGYYQYFFLGGDGGVNMSCSRTQHGDRVGLGPPTSKSGLRGVNHQATAPPAG